MSVQKSSRLCRSTHLLGYSDSYSYTSPLRARTTVTLTTAACLTIP